MPNFRKKPVVIQAVQLRRDNIEELEAFVIDSQRDVELVGFPNGEPRVTIKTLEGTMRADENDWIIRGVAGELYPCKPAIFDVTYEPVV